MRYIRTSRAYTHLGIPLNLWSMMDFRQGVGYRPDNLLHFGMGHFVLLSMLLRRVTLELHQRLFELLFHVIPLDDEGITLGS